MHQRKQSFKSSLEYQKEFPCLSEKLGLPMRYQPFTFMLNLLSLMLLAHTKSIGVITLENVPMDFCGLTIQPEDLGLQAPHLKKIHSAHTWHLKASPLLGISEQNNNFNKVNKINKKIKCLFRHIAPVSSSCKKHIMSSFHKLLSWKQFFPPHATCFRTIFLRDDDLLQISIHDLFTANVFKLFLEQHWHLP